MEIRNNRFVITGGASLIGSYIVEQLLNEGAAAVVVVDNMSLGSVEQLAHLVHDERLKLVRGDILRLEQLLEHFVGANGVFHVAGYLTLPLSQDLARGIDVNVTGTLNVLEACRWAGVEKVILSSSVAVFGNPDGVVDEYAPFNRSSPGYSDAAAIYGSTKIIGEHLARLYTLRHGVEHVSLRYASVYGGRQHGRAVNALLLTNPLDKIRNGERPEIHGDGSEVHDYINVIDIASANLAAMQSSVSSGAYTIGTGRSVSVNEVVRILLELFDSSLEPVFTTDKRALSSTVSSSFTFDVSKAEKELGWRAKIDIREGLALLKQWRETTSD